MQSYKKVAKATKNVRHPGPARPLGRSYVLPPVRRQDIDVSQTGPYAPGIDRSAEAVGGVEVGHRLIAAGEFELAIKAFNRAALDQGRIMTAKSFQDSAPQTSGLDGWDRPKPCCAAPQLNSTPSPQDLNNLGVVLMERGENSRSRTGFEKAHSHLDDGESTLIRDNLRAALAKTENPDSLDSLMRASTNWSDAAAVTF